MKKKSDPRHLKRKKIITELFAWDFNHKAKLSADTKKVVDHLKVIDKKIASSAPSRPLGEINKIDLAILRLSVFELIIDKGTPLKVVVDEAVELGKEYGADSSPSFINGALGKLIEDEKIKK